MLLSSGQRWEQQKHRGKATALVFIACLQLPHPTGSAWGSCLLEMGNPNLTCWNGIGQPGAKMMTCVSAHCISAWFYFLCGLSLSTCFCHARHPKFLLRTNSVPYRVCAFSTCRSWGIPRKKSKASYRSHDQWHQPCSHCPLQKEQKHTPGTMNTWAGTISSSNCWHWIHSVLTRGKK